MLPEGEGRIAIEDDARRRLHEKWQQVAEDFRRDRNHAVRRQERAEHVRVAEGIGERKLSQDARRQAEVDADRKDVPAAHAAAGADDELVSPLARTQSPRPVGRWIRRPPSMIERPPTLMTWQSGSMRTTGVSVEAMTCLSSRLSRISSD